MAQWARTSWLKARLSIGSCIDLPFESTRQLCSEQEEGEFDIDTHHLYGLRELVHVDVQGPTKNALLEGHMYFISIVNDYSRRCWVQPMRQRVEALELLMKWKELMENQTGRKIKVLQSDHVEE